MAYKNWTANSGAGKRPPFHRPQSCSASHFMVGVHISRRSQSQRLLSIALSRSIFRTANQLMAESTCTWGGRKEIRSCVRTNPIGSGAKLEDYSDGQRRKREVPGRVRSSRYQPINRLLKAARVGKDRMKQGDLDVLAAATMELLTMTLANMPEPIRGKRVEGLSATLAADVAKKRERLDQNILARHLETPRGSA